MAVGNAYIVIDCLRQNTHCAACDKYRNLGTAESPYTGTFNGNGHTLNINIWSSSTNRGAFPVVENATFRDLRVLLILNPCIVYVDFL